MIALATDEDCPGRFVEALRRHIPDIDIRTTIDRNLLGADDTAQLESARSEGRVLLSCDRSLGSRTATQINNGDVTIGGLIIASRNMNMTSFIDAMSVFVCASTQDDWINRVEWL